MNYPNKQKLISENIRNTDVVLDVGFVGQGVTESDPNWVHNLLKKSAKEVYGIDLDFDATQFPEPYYLKQSAESFDFPVKFDVIFAGDLIEHLSNPGLFLDSCKRNLKQGGVVSSSLPRIAITCLISPRN